MRTRVDAGFTLLELLLAMALATVIVGVIAGGLRLGSRAWETGRKYETFAEVEGEIRAVSELLSRAFPATTIGSDQSRSVAFTGGPSDCAFIALSEGEAQKAGLIFAEIGPRIGSRRTDLAVWTKAFRDGDELPASREEMTETRAIEQLVGFELSYFGAAEPGRPPEWMNVWRERDRLPRLVSLKAAVKRYGRRLETSIIVRLRHE